MSAEYANTTSSSPNHHTEPSHMHTHEEMHQLYPYNPLPFWIFLFLETFGNILGNAMLCLLFATHKTLRTGQNNFIISLSVSDMLVGLSVIPCEYCRWKASENQLGMECPLFCGSVISFNMIASVINLVLIACDRYLSIEKPFVYSRLFSKRKSLIIIALGWSISISTTVIPLIWQVGLSDKIVSQQSKFLINLIYSGFLFGLTILAGLLLLASYYKIVKTISRKTRSTRERRSNPAGVRVCIISTALFFVSWVQYSVVEILLQSNIMISSELMDGTYFIFMLSPCMDPMLYAYYRHDFRRCLVSWWNRFCAPFSKLMNSFSRTLSDEKCMKQEKVDHILIDDSTLSSSATHL